MEIFNNQQRSGYEEIVSYGPKWWTEFREMDANYRFAGWTLDLMAYWLERVINNQFPAHADEKALSVFETIFDITPEPGESLDERRRTVSAYYSGTGKLSKSVIQTIIKSYTGCDSELWWNKTTLEIRIQCNESGEFSQKKVYRIINRRIPAHIPFVIREVLCSFELTENIPFDRVSYNMEFVWWDGTLNGSHNMDGSLILDGKIGPYFRNVIPFIIENPVEIETTAFNERFQALNTFSSEIHPVHRALLNWWEELRTLDGVEFLDGSHNLDQDIPPTWLNAGYRLVNQMEENVIVSMYIPSKAKLLDGSFLLDGNINLNSGREEL